MSISQKAKGPHCSYIFTFTIFTRSLDIASCQFTFGVVMGHKRDNRALELSKQSWTVVTVKKACWDVNSKQMHSCQTCVLVVIL